jgi:hypothetical protein
MPVLDTAGQQELSHKQPSVPKQLSVQQTIGLHAAWLQKTCPHFSSD